MKKLAADLEASLTLRDPAKKKPAGAIDLHNVDQNNEGSTPKRTVSFQKVSSSYYFLRIFSFFICSQMSLWFIFLLHVCLNIISVVISFKFMILPGLILDIAVTQYSFWIFWTFFPSKNLRFTCCLAVFHVRITLNLPRVPFFIPTAPCLGFRKNALTVLNSFHIIILFLYHLKTENVWFPNIFRGEREAERDQ